MLYIRLLLSIISRIIQADICVHFNSITVSSIYQLLQYLDQKGKFA